MLFEQLINGAEFFLEIKNKEKPRTLSSRILIESNGQSLVVYAHHIIWPFFLSAVGFLVEENYKITDGKQLEIIRNFLLFVMSKDQCLQHDIVKHKENFIIYAQNLISKGGKKRLASFLSKKLKVEFGVNKDLIKIGVEFFYMYTIDDLLEKIMVNYKINLNSSLVTQTKEVLDLEVRANLAEAYLTSFIAAEQVLDGDIKEKKEFCERQINKKKEMLNQKKMHLEQLKSGLNKLLNDLNVLIHNAYGQRGINNLDTLIKLLHGDRIAQYNSQYWCQQKGFAAIGFRNHHDLFEFHNTLPFKLRDLTEQHLLYEQEILHLELERSNNINVLQQNYHEKQKQIWQNLKQSDATKKDTLKLSGP